jgi:hypothetical protein
MTSHEEFAEDWSPAKAKWECKLPLGEILLGPLEGVRSWDRGVCTVYGTDYDNTPAGQAFPERLVVTGEGDHRIAVIETDQPNSVIDRKVDQAITAEMESL